MTEDDTPDERSAPAKNPARRPWLRWPPAIVVAAVALAVALWPHSSRHAEATSSASPDPAAAQQLGVARRAAALAPCPVAVPGAVWSPHAPLRGLALECLSDGRPTLLAQALAGRPVLLNLWTYWCPPCAQELPALQGYAARAGAAAVLTVHSDPDQTAALQRLASLAVRLPGVQDGDARVRSALGASPVFPVSVLLRPDGTVAQLVVRPFADADDIAATVLHARGATG